MLNFRNIKIIKLNKSLDHKNIKSFKIIRAINNSIYKLNLFNTIKKVFFIFYFYIKSSTILYQNKDNSLFFLCIQTKTKRII